MSAVDHLIAAFGFAPFSRMQARLRGVEQYIADAETDGMIKFIGCAGVGAGLPYCAERERWRCLA